MIIEYNERSLKYFKALFADIFQWEGKKVACAQTITKEMASSLCSLYLLHNKQLNAMFLIE